MAHKLYPIKKRFWNKVDKKGPNDCWLWKANKINNKYGSFGIFNEKGQFRNTTAHRVSYLLKHGHIPNKFDICHTCDNPPCVNPKHLFSGSRKENMKDACTKGRMQKGEAHYKAKLTESQVIKIRNEHIPYKFSFKKLAKRYNVSYRTIRVIIERKAWKHI